MSFEITSLQSYREEYPRLAAALCRAGAVPARGELEFLTQINESDCLRFGMLPPPDIFFAAAVTSILAPAIAIEIGTASGFSAAILAKIIALRQAEKGAPTATPFFHTIDYKDRYVADPGLPVGFAIERITPELRDRIAIHPLQDSSFCEQLVQAGALFFAFVDGNHQHPWPLLDVLRLQALMTGGWILLHDINLPTLITRARAEGQTVEFAPTFGAKHVFDFWPGEKIQAGNIGAVKIPRERESLGELVRKLRALPREVSAGSWTKRWREIDALEKGFAPRRWL
ncbi:MAG TPA: class I SAM-dependent methyltransferase [Chthoniobacterales bacterium]|nr:class I SAM-dependent methyltransferase [Chthoniobacterales bacterium]